MPFAPAAPKPMPDRGAGAARLPRRAEGEELARAAIRRRRLVKQATYDTTYRDWDVKVWSGEAGEIAGGRVDDLSASSPRRGPARRSPGRWRAAGHGAFGGKKINSYPVWLGFCAVFLLGLADLRRPFSLRNLDLLALLSFSVSLWYFNHGHVFASASLVYPGLVYLLARTIWIGIRDRPPPHLAAGLAGLAAGRGDGVRRRLQGRPERPRLERDRRRLRGRDRRRADRRTASRRTATSRSRTT